MEWRSVHDARPSSSTSGGQSGGTTTAAGGGPLVVFVTFFVWVAQSANEVQFRQLLLVSNPFFKRKRGKCLRFSVFA